MKRIILCCLMLSFHFVGNSQISSATLQASGLTCALCAKSIFTNLSSLTFVENVDTDLNASSFLISFRKGQQIHPELLKKKVEDAGFSVSNLSFEYKANNGAINPDGLLKIENVTYHILNSKTKRLDGLVKLQIVDKGYVGIKEYKKHLGANKQACYQTADIVDCPDQGINSSTLIFHVVIK